MGTAQPANTGQPVMDSTIEYSVSPDYSASPLPGSEAFTEAALGDRLHLLRRLDLQRALPLLLVELDHTLRANIPAELRVNLLHMLKQPVLKAIAGLPKPMAEPDGSAPRRGETLTSNAGITLEQRLLLMMSRNLRHALFELDRSPNSVLQDVDDGRTWVLQQTFRFISRQVRYGVDFNRPWPKHTWQDLHDLFVYLVARGAVRVDAGFTVAVFEDEFDAEIEYKRLLLLGVVDRASERRVQSADYYHMLKRWAADSVLQDPAQVPREERVIKVEVTRDEPPRLREPPPHEAFRGWVLRPPRVFFEFLDRVTVARAGAADGVPRGQSAADGRGASAGYP